MKTLLKNKNMQGGSFNIIEWVISLGISTAVAFVMLLLCCAAVYNTKDPGAIYKYVAVGALYAAALAGGYITAKLTEKGAFGGLISGAWLFLLTLAVSLFGVGTGGDFIINLLLRIAVLALGAVGGLLGVKREKKKNIKTRMKKMRR